MPAPDTAAVTVYLAVQGNQSTEGEVAAALAAEKAAQAKTCRVPDDDADWPADLSEALYRRVAHNLALRALPLGVSAPITEGGPAAKVGGTDAEVRRLEAPYRKLPLG